MCAESNAPRYERRVEGTRSGGEWGGLRRSLVRLVRGLNRNRPELA